MVISVGWYIAYCGKTAIFGAAPYSRAEIGGFKRDHILLSCLCMIMEIMEIMETMKTTFVFACVL